ncbi:sialidase family protein [Paenibacillus sp. HB172176]|uniref:sialidase family protein n=1 Tax=Paenibacillus sp. HB172176 TaxID=2493690 RepID=UPI003211D29A
MSFLPGARYPRLGFRIASGEQPILHEKRQPTPLHETNVAQSEADWKPVSGKQPVFISPISFVRIPKDAMGPVFASHNHFPSITWCPNGDLLATWFTDPGASYTGEEGSQLNIAAARLRRGASEWEEASLFYSAADRNDHSASLWTNRENGRLYHFQGTGSFPKQGNQILFMRHSDDSGASWSTPRVMSDKRSMWNPHVLMKTRAGHMILTSDFNFDQPMWGRIIVSKDDGETWHQPAGRIVGQHPGIVELRDGRWLAIGRDNLNTQHEAVQGVGVPISITADEGETWTYRREPALGLGFNWRQRPVLIRLEEGPLLFIGFTDKWGTPDAGFVNGVEFVDQAGVRRKGYGMFAALSEDEGETWTGHKLLTPGSERKEYDGGGNTEWFETDASHAEPAGYIQAIQSPDGMIHLISSKLHYRFNYAWLRMPTVAE